MKKINIYLTFFFYISFCFSCLYATLDLNDLISQMTSEELIQTGLYKVTEEEKKYFHFWLQYKASKYYVDLPKESTPHRTSCFKTDVFLGHQQTSDDPVDEADMPWDIALCSPFQHDAKYLKEWIEYHKLVGVQHFYLYNNLSNDNYLSVLKEYIDRDEVELIEFATATYTYDYMYAQKACYTDALNRARGKARWLIIADSDLFFIPVIEDSLVSFLEDYEDFGGVTVNLYNYGTNNIYSLAPHELMTEKLTKREAEVNQHVKSIVKPHRTVEITSPHDAIYKPGFFAVDENFQRIDGAFNFSLPAEKIRINHYTSRTLEFTYQISKLRHLRFHAQLRGEPLPLVLPPGVGPEFHDTHEEEEACPVEDRIMDRFIPQIKNQME